MEITKVHKVIAVGWALPLPYKKAKAAQIKKHKSFTDECFNCHHKFKDDDKIYIATICGYDYEFRSEYIFLCKDCMKIAKKDLDEEKVLK